MSDIYEHIKILGTYKPSNYIEGNIKMELLPLVEPPCCKNEFVHIRFPDGKTPHPSHLEWHQDGPGNVHHMVIWVNEDPTELKYLETGEIIQLKPFEVTWFNADKFEHRQPAVINTNTRCFIKILCGGFERKWT